jgi:hypothetical protein
MEVRPCSYYCPAKQALQVFQLGDLILRPYCSKSGWLDTSKAFRLAQGTTLCKVCWDTPLWLPMIVPEYDRGVVGFADGRPKDTFRVLKVVDRRPTSIKLKFIKTPKRLQDFLEQWAVISSNIDPTSYAAIHSAFLNITNPINGLVLVTPDKHGRDVVFQVRVSRWPTKSI